MKYDKLWWMVKNYVLILKNTIGKVISTCKKKCIWYLLVFYDVYTK